MLWDWALLIDKPAVEQSARSGGQLGRAAVCGPNGKDSRQTGSGLKRRLDSEPVKAA